MFKLSNGAGYTICTIFLLIVMQSYAADIADEIINKCLTANNITQEEYAALQEQSSSEEDLDNVERKYKCLLNCLAKEMDILDANDHVDVELVDKLTEFNEEDRAALYECKRQYDELDDSCEYAFQMMLCAIKTIDPKAEN